MKPDCPLSRQVARNLLVKNGISPSIPLSRIHKRQFARPLGPRGGPSDTHHYPAGYEDAKKIVFFRSLGWKCLASSGCGENGSESSSESSEDDETAAALPVDGPSNPSKYRRQGKGPAAAPEYPGKEGKKPTKKYYETYEEWLEHAKERKCSRCQSVIDGSWDHKRDVRRVYEKSRRERQHQPQGGVRSLRTSVLKTSPNRGAASSSHRPAPAGSSSWTGSSASHR